MTPRLARLLHRLHPRLSSVWREGEAGRPVLPGALLGGGRADGGDEAMSEHRVTWPHHCPTWDSPGGCRCMVSTADDGALADPLSVHRAVDEETGATVNLDDQRDGFTREQALLSAANFIEHDMGAAWGGDTAWLTTGHHVAKLVAGVLRDRAHQESP